MTKRNRNRTHWTFVRETFRQYNLAKLILPVLEEKISNLNKGDKVEADPNLSSSINIDERYRKMKRRRENFLQQALSEEAFVLKIFGMDRSGMCVRHPNQLIGMTECQHYAVNTCRICRSESQGGDDGRIRRHQPAMINVIEEVQQLQADRTEWKRRTSILGMRSSHHSLQIRLSARTFRINDDDSFYDDDGSDNEFGDESDEYCTKKEGEWAELARARIIQVRAWQDFLGVKNHPFFCHYFKMVQYGIPVDAVKYAVETDGYDPSIMDLEMNLSLEVQLDRLSSTALEKLRSKGVSEIGQSGSEKNSIDVKEYNITDTIQQVMAAFQRRRMDQIFALHALFQEVKYSETKIKARERRDSNQSVIDVSSEESEHKNSFKTQNFSLNSNMIVNADSKHKLDSCFEEEAFSNLTKSGTKSENRIIDYQNQSNKLSKNSTTKMTTDSKNIHGMIFKNNLEEIKPESIEVENIDKPILNRKLQETSNTNDSLNDAPSTRRRDEHPMKDTALFDDVRDESFKFKSIESELEALIQRESTCKTNTKPPEEKSKVIIYDSGEESTSMQTGRGSGSKNINPVNNSTISLDISATIICAKKDAATADDIKDNCSKDISIERLEAELLQARKVISEKNIKIQNLEIELTGRLETIDCLEQRIKGMVGASISNTKIQKLQNECVFSSGKTSQRTSSCRKRTQETTDKVTVIMIASSSKDDDSDGIKTTEESTQPPDVNDDCAKVLSERALRNRRTKTLKPKDISLPDHGRRAEKSVRNAARKHQTNESKTRQNEKNVPIQKGMLKENDTNTKQVIMSLFDELIFPD